MIIQIVLGVVILFLILLSSLLLLWGIFIRTGKLVKMQIFLCHRSGIAIDHIILANQRFGSEE